MSYILLPNVLDQVCIYKLNNSGFQEQELETSLLKCFLLFKLCILLVKKITILYGSKYLTQHTAAMCNF